jgi:hypothetical protein
MEPWGGGAGLRKGMWLNESSESSGETFPIGDMRLGVEEQTSLMIGGSDMSS